MLFFLLSIVDESKHDKVWYLYNKYNDDLISYARSELKRKNDKNYENDAWDVVQNTFLRLIQYMPEEIKFEKSYVFKILTNEIYKHLNKTEYYEDIDDNENLASEEDFEEIVAEEDNKKIIATIIYNLEDKFRMPIIMKYEFEMSVKDIAEQLDLAVPSVYSRLEKAYGLIKEEYERIEGKNGHIKL